MTTPLKLGIIGAGRMGIIHYSIANALDGVSITSIADPSKQITKMLGKYPLMAMSTPASGAVPAPEAYDYVNRLNIQSVVFGASSPGNIKQTVSLIEPVQIEAAE